MQVSISASVGVALALHPDDLGPELVRRADTATYRAKRPRGDGARGAR